VYRVCVSALYSDSFRYVFVAMDWYELTCRAAFIAIVYRRSNCMLKVFEGRKLGSPLALTL